MIDKLVEDERQRDRALASVARHRMPFRFSIVDGRPRSYDQNRLYWQWSKDAAAQRPGMSISEIQSEWKLLFGIPILATENEAFGEAWLPVEANCTHQQKLGLMTVIAVTSLMTVDQFKRFLDEVQRYNVENDIELTDTEEHQYGPAQGRRVDRGAGPSDTAAGTKKGSEAAEGPVSGLYTGLQREAQTGDAPRTTTGEWRRKSGE